MFTCKVYFSLMKSPIQIKCIININIIINIITSTPLHQHFFNTKQDIKQCHRDNKIWVKKNKQTLGTCKTNKE